MTATAGGEHFNTTRRSTWVSRISGIVERNEEPRWEIWDLCQIPLVLAELKVASGRLGFELGDCMTLGISVNDFLRLRTLLPRARLDDASPLIRKLMSVHTDLEIERLRSACEAGIAVHDMVPSILRAGMTERVVLDELSHRFRERFPTPDHSYQPAGGWDVRNSSRADSNPFHTEISDRAFRGRDLPEPERR
jgi:Xaa-Pro aminopeptidase